LGELCLIPSACLGIQSGDCEILRVPVWLENVMTAVRKVAQAVSRAWRFLSGDAAKRPFLELPIQVGDGSAGDQRIAEALLNEAGVIVNPGYQFGSAGQGHFRLCFAQDEVAWLPALDRIGATLRAVLTSAA